MYNCIQSFTPRSLNLGVQYTAFPHWVFLPKLKLKKDKETGPYFVKEVNEAVRQARIELAKGTKKKKKCKSRTSAFVYVVR